MPSSMLMIADHIEMRGMAMTEPATAQGNGRCAITAEFVHGGNWRVTGQVNQNCGCRCGRRFPFFTFCPNSGWAYALGARSNSDWHWGRHRKYATPSYSIDWRSLVGVPPIAPSPGYSP
jgi:hypothetical protein